MGGLGDEYHKRRPRGLRDYLEPGALDRLTPAELKALRAEVASQMPSTRELLLRPFRVGDYAEAGKTGDMWAYQPSWREQIAQTLADTFGTSRYGKQYIAEKAREGADFVPLVGTALGVDDTARAFEAGDWTGVAFGVGTTLLGALPLAGGLLSKGGKRAARWLGQAGDGFGGLEIAAPFARAAAPLERASALGEASDLSRSARLADAVLKDGATEGEPFATKVFREAGTPNGPYEDLPLQHPARAAAQPYVLASPDGKRPFTKLFRELDPPNVPQFDLTRNDPAMGVSQRTLDLLNNHQVWDTLGRMMLTGIAKGQHRWWNFEPLRVEFAERLGRDRGNQAFEQFTDFVSASSPLSEMGVSSRNGSFYLWSARDGEWIPSIERNPFPYGHRAEAVHKRGIHRVLERKWNSAKTPKTPSMAQAMRGNATPVPIDSKLFKALGILSQDPRFLKGFARKMFERGYLSMEDAIKKPHLWQEAPRPNEYAALERRFQAMARDAGVRPADGEGALWPEIAGLTGMRSDPNKLGMDFIFDRIMKTATQPIDPKETIRKGPREPRDVLSDFVRRRYPLLGLGGVALGGAAFQNGQQSGQPKRPPTRDRS
jgi:hypothetical protein